MKDTRPATGEPRRCFGPWPYFEDEIGFSMAFRPSAPGPQQAHPDRAGAQPLPTPPVDRRPDLLQAGRAARLIYRPRRGDSGDGRRSFAWSDYRNLLITAHLQLGGPIVVIWDNLNTHRTAGMRRFIAEHDWLTVHHLPPYTPQLNPVEGIWSLLRPGALANRIFTDPEDLIRVVRRGLRAIEYRTNLIDGVMAETGMTTGPPS